MNEYRNYYTTNELSPPCKYWIATDEDDKSSSATVIIEFENEDKLINSVVNSVADLVDNKNADLNDRIDCNYDNNKDCTCSDIDDWFQRLLSNQKDRNTKGDAIRSKAQSDADKLKKDTKMANEKTPQYDLNKLSNQMLF